MVEVETRPDRRPTLRERNRQRTRSAILDSTAELLGETGYSSISLEEVSQRAGLARGTLYAHFPGGREEIVQEVYLRIADAVYVRGISLREEAHDVPSRVAALARSLVETTSTPAGRFYGILGPDIVPVLSTVMGSTSKSFEALIRLDLAAASGRGQLKKGSDIDAFAAALSGAIRASGFRSATEPHVADQQVEAVRLLTQGLLS